MKAASLQPFERRRLGLLLSHHWDFCLGDSSSSPVYILIRFADFGGAGSRFVQSRKFFSFYDNHYL